MGVELLMLMVLHQRHLDCFFESNKLHIEQISYFIHGFSTSIDIKINSKLVISKHPLWGDAPT